MSPIRSLRFSFATPASAHRIAWFAFAGGKIRRIDEVIASV
jgi:hypothetical protein